MSAVPRCWVAVASAEHARRGRDQGFMQVCHGKAAPLKRPRAGDRGACCAPAETMGGNVRLQSFVRLGEMQAGKACTFDKGGGLVASGATWLIGPSTDSGIRPWHA